MSGSLCGVKVMTAGRPVALMTSVATSASPVHENVSPMTKSTPASTAQPTCSSNIARTPSRASSPVHTFVLQTLPASIVPVSRATSRARASAWRLIASSRCSWPMIRSFSRWA